MMSVISQYVFNQINSILEQKNNSGGRARLARLRRGIGKAPGELPELWGEFLNGLPEELFRKNEALKNAEWAIYISLTLFALHQQVLQI